MDVKDILDKAVVSIADGTKLGYVRNLFFNPQDRRLTALEIQRDGDRVLLAFDQINNLGTDAITVAQSQVFAPIAQQDWVGLDALKQRKVVDSAGTLLGKIERVRIEPITGMIEELTVHEGGILGLGGTSRTIPSAAIRAVGADLITVAGAESTAQDT